MKGLNQQKSWFHTLCFLISAGEHSVNTRSNANYMTIILREKGRSGVPFVYTMSIWLKCVRKHARERKIANDLGLL